MGKAEDDYRAAVDLNRRRKAPVPDIVCYHCQQSAEKYLKAYLVQCNQVPPWIHDLRRLVDLCAFHDASLTAFLPLAQLLNPYGTVIRYPSLAATQVDAQDAMKALRRVRKVLRKKLGL